MPQSIDPRLADELRARNARMSRFIDEHQYDKLTDIVLPEFTNKLLDAGGKQFLVNGQSMDNESRDAWIAGLRERVGDKQSMHVFGPGEFEQVSPDEVKVIWASMWFMEAVAPGLNMHTAGGGHHYATWVKRGEEWWLKELTVKFLYTKAIPLP